MISKKVKAALAEATKDQLACKEVTYHTLEADELERFITRHLGKPFNVHDATSWRDDGYYKVEVYDDDAPEDVEAWLKDTKSQANRRCVHPSTALSYIRAKKGITIPKVLLVHFCT